MFIARQTVLANRSRSLMLALGLVCSHLLWSPAFGQDANAELTKEQAQLLSEIRAAMAGRDFATAQAKLADAKKTDSPAGFVVQTERLQSLYDYVFDFWKKVDEGGRSLAATQELVIKGQRVAVVEYTQGLLILRVAGQNRRYTPKTMPASVVMTLASRVLKTDSAQNKVYFGAFHAVDAKGDRAEARRLWQEAAQAGVDVAVLLPELEVSSAAVATTEIPRLTAVMRAMLKPSSWSVRRRDKDRWIRSPIDDMGKQNAEGRLVISYPESEAGDAQIVNRRALTSLFLCRVVLQNVAESQSFGFYSEDSDDAFLVELPAGSMLIEFGRQNSGFVCRINGKDAKVTSTDSASPRMRGHVGFSVSPGDQCTIAASELRGR
jgi:hypothetical protein